MTDDNTKDEPTGDGERKAATVYTEPQPAEPKDERIPRTVVVTPKVMQVEQRATGAAPQE